MPIRFGKQQVRLRVSVGPTHLSHERSLWHEQDRVDGCFAKGSITILKTTEKLVVTHPNAPLPGNLGRRQT
jgi:hypothetical protein